LQKGYAGAAVVKPTERTSQRRRRFVGKVRKKNLPNAKDRPNPSGRAILLLLGGRGKKTKVGFWGGTYN